MHLESSSDFLHSLAIYVEHSVLGTGNTLLQLFHRFLHNFLRSMAYFYICGKRRRMLNNQLVTVLVYTPMHKTNQAALKNVIVPYFVFEYEGIHMLVVLNYHLFIRSIDQ